MSDYLDIEFGDEDSSSLDDELQGLLGDTEDGEYEEYVDPQYVEADVEAEDILFQRTAKSSVRGSGRMSLRQAKDGYDQLKDELEWGDREYSSNNTKLRNK